MPHRSQCRGIIEAGFHLTVLDDGFAEREPALAQLGAAAVSGLPVAGPELRRRPEPVMLRGHPGVEVTAPLSVTELGFSLHAATRAGAEDARGREALCKYVLRPPLSRERLSLPNSRSLAAACASRLASQVDRSQRDEILLRGAAVITWQAPK
jgi:hypothetical protein